MATASSPDPTLSRRRPRRTGPLLGPRGLSLGHVAGVEITVDASWVLIFALVAWAAASRFPEAVPGLETGQALVLGAIASLLLFASVLGHELSPSLVAIARGYEVRRIRLFIFGGVSELQGEARTAGDELWIAIVGPLASLGFAGAAGVAAVACPSGSASAALFQYLATANLIIAIFNMLPGLPLDGGRVLRAAIRATGRSLVAATRQAAAVGRALGAGLMALGIAAFVFGGGLGGLWFAFVGWFLRSSATSSARALEVRQQLEGLRAGDLTRAVRPLVADDTVHDALLERGLLGTDLARYPVVSGRELLGFVRVDELRELPRERWATVRVGHFGLERVPAVRPTTPLLEALEVLAHEGGRELAVVDEGRRLLGLLALDDVGRIAAARREKPSDTGGVLLARG